MYYKNSQNKGISINMNENSGILQDIRTIRDIEASLEEAESYISRVKSNKVRLTLTNAPRKHQIFPGLGRAHGARTMLIERK